MNQSRIFATLRQSMALMAGETPLARVLEAIVDGVEAEDPTQICSIVLLDDNHLRLRPGAAPRLPKAFMHALDGLPIGPMAGSCGAAMARKARVISRDIRVDPLWAIHRSLGLPPELVSCWSQPIVVGTGVVGSFAMYGRAVGSPAPAQIALIEAAADLAAMAIGRDLRERLAVGAHAREQALARKFETLFDVSLDILCIVQNGRFIRVSRAWTELLDWPLNEVEGHHYSEFVHPDDLAAAHAIEAEVMHTGEIAAIRNRYRRRDGSYRALEWRARAAGDELYCMARDVTEQIQFERETVAARAAAEAANEAKSNFLANMSHEIRTPLNGVIGLLDALQATPLSVRQAEIVGMISESGRALEHLVSEILDLSRIEAGRMDLVVVAFDLDALVQSACAKARLTAAGKGLSFAYTGPEDSLPPLLGDAGRVRQVIDNLISNAVKFTPAGEVAVTVAVDGSDALSERLCTICVKDTGVGFSPAIADTIFERFHQGDPTRTRRFGGSGLGLTICKALIESMGGSISARSGLGEGSTFTVALPLALAEPPEAAPQAEPAPPAPRALRVLLAEDHPINRRVVELMLEPFDMDLTAVENGEDAVSAFASGDFDLVLMDLQMPVMDGLSAIRAIRAMEGARATGTPIIALSANAMEHHRHEALTAGADLHVAKPVSSVSLIAGIQQVLTSI